MKHAAGELNPFNGNRGTLLTFSKVARAKAMHECKLQYRSHEIVRFAGRRRDGRNAAQ